ncbi:tRNA 1-methyladenosine methyltransferase subunit [Saccharomycopsis crataegensis]|uniref:tRNA (adenine(58)-N(1))-methyltransferase non-catalytic subunit TRM6 n=1 Tax=Saccharomycopsis crataegensis TaxID=43959 RepID=A0AAV5QUR9_9ASCO|nr:tRNA 1-methyladenosine methyltransferase subunit [Saccharomycopsis crataegensis]
MTDTVPSNGSSDPQPAFNLQNPVIETEGLAKLDTILDQIAAFNPVSAPNELTGNPDEPRNFDPKLYLKNITHIKENEWVLVRLPSQGSKLVELKKDRVVSLGKFGNFQVNQILGYKFGQTFEVMDNDNVKPVDGRPVFDEISASIGGGGDDEEEEEEEEEIEVEQQQQQQKQQGKQQANENQEIANQLQNSADQTNKDKADIIEKLMKFSEDNSNLVDLGAKVQTLSTLEIEAMKKQSYSSETGRKIIESIINQHGNFDKKTKYSQAKYLRRKREKYSRFFIIEYISAKELLNYYIDNKDIRKSLDLSEESMAYILNLANVRPGGRYLIMDESLGLLTYCMLERMNGQGEIVVVSENEHVNLTALERYSNYPPVYINKMVKTIDFLQFISPIDDILASDEACAFFKPLPKDEVDKLSKTKKARYVKKFSNYSDLIKILKTCKSGNFDGLILLTTLYIPSVLESLIGKVGGSRSVVIYSQFKELLVETFHAIANQNIPILGASVYETRARSYQAVPGKIHPVMTSRGGGGYVMWGTRVFQLEKVEAVGKGNKKKKQKMESSP